MALSLIALGSITPTLNPTRQARTTDVTSLSTFKQQQALEAFIAALLFASHPIHTEAVAGIVGHAELLSAALAMLALLVYMAAAREGQGKRHYQMLSVSVLMLWSAALAKEIGITMV